MLLIIVLIASLNLIFCLYRMSVSLKRERFISVAWLLISYYAALILIEVSSGDMFFMFGSTGVGWRHNSEDYLGSVLFISICNVTFCVGESFFAKIFEIDGGFRGKSLKHGGEFLLYLYVVVFVVSFFVYINKMSGASYRDYVEYSQSDWSRVFLFSSLSVFTISLLKNVKFVVLVVFSCMAYLSYVLQVRSFIVPLILCAIFVAIINRGLILGKLRGIKKASYYVLFLITVFVVFGAISYKKIGQLVLPEIMLPKYLLIVIDKIRYGSDTLGFNSIYGFLHGCALPWIKLFSFASLSPDADTPVYAASLIFDTTNFQGVYYHFPVLWYGDAYISFGSYGAFLGFFWGFILVVTEYVLKKNELIFVMFSQFYAWLLFFIIRGAIANSTISISYAFYMQLLFYLLYAIRPKKYVYTYGDK